MASLMAFWSRLLPFANPGTPLIQDLAHLVAICALLYFAPQIQERWRSRNEPTDEADRGEAQPAAGGPAPLNVPEGDALQGNMGVGQDGDPPDEEFQRPIEEGHAGPVAAPDIPAQRNVGAKKAKSLARRDQRRAYNEFMRSQGEAQRARDAEGAAEREAAVAAEKERRKAAEAALEAKRARERERKREREEAERKEEIRRRELAISVVREGLESQKMCNLLKVAKQVGGDVDEEWVEKILNASGMIGKSGDVMTVITGMGWVVRVTSDDMQGLYRTAAEAELGDGEGRIGCDELGSLLESSLRHTAVPRWTSMTSCPSRR